ncbi:MAG: fructokinase [Rhodothermales bacterium]|jgi:fructokinase
MKDVIVCVGEVLWDSMPSSLFLGGAPYNVAYHLHQLGANTRLVSRVGDDVLGHEILRRLVTSGLETECVGMDRGLPTGFVRVDMGSHGIPTYDIVRPSAWDAISIDPSLLERLTQAKALVFGSLAQRSEKSRDVIRALSGSIKPAVFDVNMRPPYVDRTTIEASLAVADYVKLNAEELGALSRWFGLPGSPRDAARSLARRFDCAVVCVTKGADGASLWHDGQWTEHPGFPADARDTVGSGDAFLAALLDGLLKGRDDASALAFACRLGSFVATKSGATPQYTLEEVR